MMSDELLWHCSRCQSKVFSDFWDDTDEVSAELCQNTRWATINNSFVDWNLPWAHLPCKSSLTTLGLVSKEPICDWSTLATFDILIHKRRSRLKSFNPRSFPASPLQCDLRQMLPLSGSVWGFLILWKYSGPVLLGSVWGSQENKLRSLFGGTRPFFRCFVSRGFGCLISLWFAPRRRGWLGMGQPTAICGSTLTWLALSCLVLSCLKKQNVTLNEYFQATWQKKNLWSWWILWRSNIDVN